MPKHAIKAYLRAIHKFFVDTLSHELGRGLERGFDCGVCLRGAALRIVFFAKQFVRAG